MKKNIKLLLVAAAALAMTSTQAATASAATIRPMGFDACGTNADSGIFNCMYILGSGDVAQEVRGWSQATTSYLTGLAVHEEVQGPNGNAFCNSATITSVKSQVVGCQKTYSGGADILAGQYCAILWAWVYGPTGVSPTYYWHYANEAENCGNISV